MLIANLRHDLLCESTQKRIVDKVIEGVLTKEDLLQGKPDIIHRKIGSEKKIVEHHEVYRISLLCNHFITILGALKKNRDLLTNENHLKRFKKAQSDFNKKVRDILNGE